MESLNLESSSSIRDSLRFLPREGKRLLIESAGPGIRGNLWHSHTETLRLSPLFPIISDAGLLHQVGVGASPQGPAGPVRADDDARGHSLRADQREFAWRRSIRKDAFAGA